MLAPARRCRSSTDAAMPRRYPKPSIRPERFKLNPYSPLYDRLQFAYLGGHGYETKSATLIDASPYQRHGVYMGYEFSGDPWGYWKELRREYLRARPNGTNRGFGVSAVCGPLWGDTSAFTMSQWVSGRFDPNTWVITSVINTIPPGYRPHAGMLQVGYTGEFSTLLFNANESWFAVKHFDANMAPSWTPFHVSSTMIRSGSTVNVRTYANGRPVRNETHNYTPRSEATRFAPGGDQFDYAVVNTTFDGLTADYMVWYRMLVPSEHAALADPDNVDLRVPGGPPLILPVRTYWPGISFKETGNKVPWHLFSTST